MVYGKKRHQAGRGQDGKREAVAASKEAKAELGEAICRGTGTQLAAFTAGIKRIAAGDEKGEGQARVPLQVLLGLRRRLEEGQKAGRAVLLGSVPVFRRRLEEGQKAGRAVLLGSVPVFRRRLEEGAQVLVNINVGIPKREEAQAKLLVIFQMRFTARRPYAAGTYS